RTASCRAVSTTRSGPVPAASTPTSTTPTTTFPTTSSESTSGTTRATPRWPDDDARRRAHGRGGIGELLLPRRPRRRPRPRPRSGPRSGPLSGRGGPAAVLGRLLGRDPPPRRLRLRKP